MEEYKQILIAKIKELSKSRSPFATSQLTILIRLLKDLN